MSAILYTQGVHGGYTDDIEVREGEIVTLPGPNGSGKSTLAKAIMGLLPRCSGKTCFPGKDLLSVPSEDRIKVGMSYVPQVANIFPSLTVLENLEVVEGILDRRASIQQVLELFPSLAERQRRRASSLSGGERQQLAFARALMSQPRLMLLDEPTANLSPALVQQVLDLISDRGYILDNGRVVLSGDAQTLLTDERMAELYLGQSF